MRNTKALRVLHSAALLSPPSGILSQMQWENEAAQELGLPWSVVMFCPLNSMSNKAITHFDDQVDSSKINSPLRKCLAWRDLRKNYHQWLLTQQDQVDVFVLRYYVHDPYQMLFTKRCKKPIFFVHHTLETPELALGGHVSAFIRSNLEKIFGRLTLPRATGLVAVTDEILRYEKHRASLDNVPAFIYPNGIIYKASISVDNRTGQVPELLFVANFAPWHGLDILLKALLESEEKCILHLVGKIPEELLPLVNDDRIVVHGALAHAQIAELSQRCWLGLSSFGLWRNKMKQACPLKVREYLSLGLPVYGNYTDVFPQSVGFFRSGSENIREICTFAKESRVLSKREISASARTWIDKAKLLTNLDGFLYQVVGTSRHQTAS